MAKQKKPGAKSTKRDRFVLGSDDFARISAVEGIRLTDAMRTRAREARAKGATAEEYRNTIIRSHRKG